MLAGPRSVVGARRRGWPRHGVLIALAIVLLLTLAPFLVVAINAVKTPSDYAEHGPIALPRALDLTSIGEFWRRVDFTRKLLNSFVVSGAVAVLGVALSVMNAYALGIGKLRGRSWFLLFFLAANLVPQEALVYPLYYLSKLAHLYDSLTVLIIIFTVIQGAFGTYLLASIYDHFPRELIDAAEVDGAGRWQILVRIVVPLSWETLSVLFASTSCATARRRRPRFPPRPATSARPSRSRDMAASSASIVPGHRHPGARSSWAGARAPRATAH